MIEMHNIYPCIRHTINYRFFLVKDKATPLPTPQGVKTEKILKNLEKNLLLTTLIFIIAREDKRPPPSASKMYKIVEAEEWNFSLLRSSANVV